MSDMTGNDIIDIDIEEIAAAIDGSIRDASVEDERLHRRELRKQRRAKARGYEDMLIQRDAIAARANRLVRRGDALVIAIENFLDALSDEDTEVEVLNSLRMRLGDAVDEFDCEVGNLNGGEEE